MAGNAFQNLGNPIGAGKAAGRASSISLQTIGIFLMVALQVAILFILVFKPFDEESLNKEVINEVMEKVNVNPYEVPTVAVIANAESLKNQNTIQSEVYRNAQDGDFVLGFSDRMVIYRRDTGEVIYEGDTPGALLSKTQKEVSEKVKIQAINSGILPAGATDEAQLSVVSDPATLKSRDANFYKDVAEGDIIAVFAESGVIVIYRQSTDTIIKSGTYSTSISVK